MAWKSWKSLLIAGVTALSAAHAEAQSVKVKVNGTVVSTTTTNNDDIVVSLGTVTSNTLVQVYADESTPTFGVNSITLDGTISGTPVVQLLVARSSVTTFPNVNDVGQTLLSGLRDIGPGGIVFTDNGLPNDALRDATIIAASVNGNILGSIEAGRIFTLQARGRQDPADPTNPLAILGGGIGSNDPVTPVYPTIRSTVDDTVTLDGDGNPVVLLGNNSIGVLRAARTITASIRSDVGSIGRVSVTPLADEGIRADIVSHKNIGAVFSSGDIAGYSGGQGKIHAGNRIEQIRTVSEDAQGVLLANDLKAEVRTGYIEGAAAYVGVGIPRVDAPLGLLTVGGSASGGIHVRNLTGISSPSDPSGIFIGDSLTGNLTVDYVVDRSRIVAKSLSGMNLIVGVRLDGSIIEFARDDFDPPDMDDENRLMSFLSIGYEADSHPAPPDFEQYADQVHGMTGTDCSPVDISPRTLLDPRFWWERATPCDGQAFDGLVRIHGSKQTKVRRMTLERGVDPNISGGPNRFANYKPRIEANILRDLIVGPMEAGVIWSGSLDFDGTTVDNDLSNDYCRAKPIIIECMSPDADVYFDGDVITTFTVLNNMNGQIWLPNLPSSTPTDGLILIGSSLGKGIDLCGGSESVPDNRSCVQPPPASPYLRLPCAVDPNENSPRGFPGGVQFHPTGEIRLAEAASLQGQIVTNASRALWAPPWAVGWQGKVIIGSETLSPLVLEPEPGHTPPPVIPAERRAPFYQATPDQLGGGAVGVAPFFYHRSASTPTLIRETIRDLPMFSRTLRAQEFFESPSPITIQFYGPVLLPDAHTPPVAQVFAYSDDDGDYTIDATSKFSVTVDSTNHRIVRIAGASGLQDSDLCPPTQFSVGYLLVLSEDFVPAPESVIGGTQPTGPMSFMFNVMYDCNVDYMADIQLIQIATTCLDCGKRPLGSTSLQPGSDGILDQCQGGVGDTFNDRHSWEQCSTISACIGQCQGGYPGDVNGDGIANIDDIFIFLNAWFAMHPGTDVDLLNGINIDDIFIFLNIWFAPTTNNTGCQCITQPNYPNGPTRNCPPIP
jgi:hypothetical protein